jgi:hypothetical protein
MNPGTSTSTHILSGWKDIANYLGKGVRTVQRYEEELRLPVRRPAGKPRGSVVATAAELDAWVAARPIREEFQVKTAADPQCLLSRVAVRQSIREMHTLQDQMRVLRAEMKTSLSSLGRNIQSLHLGMTKKDLHFASTFGTIDRPGVSNVVLDLVGDFSLPKAS